MAKGTLRFHPSLDPSDFFLLHPSLIEIVGNMIDHILGEYGLIPTITSMIRPKVHDSGVHQTGRALDLSRYEHDFGSISQTGAHRIIGAVPEKACKQIADMINAVYPRSDDHLTCDWHDSGQGWHWHIQVPGDKHFYQQEKNNIALAFSRTRRV